MNKEEIENRIKELKNYTQEVWTDNELLQHDMRILSLEKMLLQQENKQLKEKINKTIEYAESYLPYYNFDHTNLKKILEILKGE